MAGLDATSLEAIVQFFVGILGLYLGFGQGPRPSAKVKQVLRWGSPALMVFAVIRFVQARGSEPIDAETLASEIRAKLSLPIQVDEDTRLDDIRATSKQELGYFLTLTKTTKAQADQKALAKPLEDLLRVGACKNPNYLWIFRAKLGLRVTYSSSDAIEVARIALTPKDCGL